MIKADRMPASPSKTAQLRPMFTFAAEGFVDEEGELVLLVPDPVPLAVPDGEVPVETLEFANG